MPKFRVPLGMHDLLPQDLKFYKKIEDTVKEILDYYHFQRIETPILEYTEVFSKGVGYDTDIVEKEMYNLKTRGGDELSLRPEGTAAIIRAYLEHSFNVLPQPVKLWYFGAFFRHEKPQAGRYRQFWQFGLENIGDEDPVFDAQTIKISINILMELGLKNLTVQINSIGEARERKKYEKVLLDYFENRKKELCFNCQRRLTYNPLRVLDCKEECCQNVSMNAPSMLDYLLPDSKKHFEAVLEYLDGLGVEYNLNSCLVRGLDYYNRTVFEITGITNPGAADKKDLTVSLIGGGRYDGLAKILGGKNLPAVGAAGGIERIIEAMKTINIELEKNRRPDVFLAQIGDLAKKKCLILMEALRKNKIFSAEALGKDSLKAQLKLADKLGVKYSLIIGQAEAVQDRIIIRNMRTGDQDTKKTEEIIKYLKEKLAKK